VRMDSRKLVVHCKKSKYDVYIGRPNPSIVSPTYKWGNPFVIGKDGDREDVIRKFEEWFLNQPQLIDTAKRELKGKVLGCWCAPQACHGDVLSRVANSEDDRIPSDEKEKLMTSNKKPTPSPSSKSEKSVFSSDDFPPLGTSTPSKKR